MNEKTKSILAYLFGWIGGLIVLYAAKDNSRTTKLHAAQAIVASLGYTIILMIYNMLPFSIPFFTTILWVLYIIVIIMGIVRVNKDQDPELPVIGEFAKKIFGKKIDE